VNGITELEAAATPNMDALAMTAPCGVHTLVATGTTSCRGPGHLALFGYDQLEHPIGRGILKALGPGMDVRAACRTRSPFTERAMQRVTSSST
jgi:2,3-bisphosphoglycerate-independent phosphoglycerate mutase